ncbi:MAG: tyrosine-type recombinase/integrase [Gaiellaceae bacterium]
MRAANRVRERERDRLLLALFAYAGLRRSELLGLDWDDVDLERRLLRIRTAKRALRRRTQRYSRVTGHELCGAVKRLRWAGGHPPHSAASS